MSDMNDALYARINELEAEVARLRSAIRDAANKLAGRPDNATAGQLDSLINDVINDLCEVENDFDGTNLPGGDPS